MPTQWSPGQLPLWYARSISAARYARDRGGPGVEFNRFGRGLGWKLLRRGRPRKGISHILAPLNASRYFEFPLARSFLPPNATSCLDVSSPRLFSLYVAAEAPSRRILMVNPDAGDLATTELILKCVGLRNVDTLRAGVQALSSSEQTFDCVWSLSVVEHISGDCDDSGAVRLMYDRLKSGGRLILTVPVDRRFGEEYRADDPYGTQARSGESFFFQRVYDEEAIHARLVAPLGSPSVSTRWYGETCPGVWNEYEGRSMRDGLECIVDDPREMTDHYREYGAWAEMPGVGVCCLMMEKP